MNTITVRVTESRGLLDHRSIEFTLAEELEAPALPQRRVPEAPAPAIDVTTVPSVQPRFIKIDENGRPLPADAPSWCAVLDTSTNLMWQADVDSTRRTWSDAEEYCDELELATYADWRRPTIKELLTLVDYDKHEPAIDTAFFPDCPSSWFWTASPAAWAPSRSAWLVNFANGLAYTLGHDNDGFVRAVRSVASPGQ